MVETVTAPAPGAGDPGLARRLRARWVPGRISPVAASRWVTAAVLAVVAAGMVARLLWSGPLWLDEAQSVDIARLPLPGLFAALRRDGSPPLYYLLLHGWMALFGTSTLAVRAMSSLIGWLTLPVGFTVGTRIGGRRLGAVMVVLLAASPFAIRYATETRMYELLILLVLLGLLALPRALRDPRLSRLAWVTALTAALAYTHYWSFFLLGAVAAWLLWHRQLRVFAAMAVAGVLYLPWLPSLIFQLRHTGTPWAGIAEPRILVDSIFQWGGPGSAGVLLAAATLLLAAVGFAGRPLPGAPARVELLLRGRPGGRWPAVLLVATLALAVLSAHLVGGAFDIRYTAVVFPLWLLLLARGVVALPSTRIQAVVVTGCVVAGLISGITWGRQPRTQAGQVVAALRSEASPGDVVAYCPDQLAPSVNRLLPASMGLKQMTFADPTGPALVDWVDYQQRIAAADPTAFAEQLLSAAGPGHTIWLVQQSGYRGLGDSCQAIASALELFRGTPAQQVTASPTFYEPMNLDSFPPPPSTLVASPAIP